MDPAEKYFIHQAGEVKGPFSLVRLVNLIKDGKLKPDVQVAEEGEESNWIALAAHAPTEVAEAIQAGAKRKFLAMWGLSAVITFVAVLIVSQILLLPQKNAARAKVEALEEESTSSKQALDEAQREKQLISEALENSKRSVKEAASATEIAKNSLADAVKDLNAARSRAQKVEVVASNYAKRLATQTVALQRVADVPEKVKVSVACGNGILTVDEDAIDAVISNALSNAGFGVINDPDSSISESLVILASVDQLKVSDESRAVYLLELKCYTRCVRGEYIKPYLLYENTSFGYAGTQSKYSSTFRDFFSDNIQKCIAKLNQAKQDASDQKPPSDVFADLHALGISPHEDTIAAEISPSASGSGIIIASRPLILTNHHVVDKATTIFAHAASFQRKEAIILYEDPRSDLAILTLKERTSDFVKDTFAAFASDQDIQIGNEVFSLGFPMSSVLGSELKFSSGAVSSVKGLRDDPECFQLTAPIQPGSSGGPVFLRSGKLAGIVVSTLNPLTFAKSTATLPQNVNYALRSDTILRFLRANGLLTEIESEERAELTIESAKRHVVRIEIYGSE